MHAHETFNERKRRLAKEAADRAAGARFAPYAFAALLRGTAKRKARMRNVPQTSTPQLPASA